MSEILLRQQSYELTDLYELDMLTLGAYQKLCNWLPKGNTPKRVSYPMLVGLWGRSIRTCKRWLEKLQEAKLIFLEKVRKGKHVLFTIAVYKDRTAPLLLPKPTEKNISENIQNNQILVSNRMAPGEKVDIQKVYKEDMINNTGHDSGQSCPLSCPVSEPENSQQDLLSQENPGFDQKPLQRSEIREEEEKKKEVLSIQDNLYVENHSLSVDKEGEPQMENTSNEVDNQKSKEGNRDPKKLTRMVGESLADFHARVDQRVEELYQESLGKAKQAETEQEAPQTQTSSKAKTEQADSFSSFSSIGEIIKTDLGISVETKEPNNTPEPQRQETEPVPNNTPTTNHQPPTKPNTAAQQKHDEMKDLLRNTVERFDRENAEANAKRKKVRQCPKAPTFTFSEAEIEQKRREIIKEGIAKNPYREDIVWALSQEKLLHGEY